ncbi:hypothetical protein [Actinoplanes sp. NPDC051851]|uniref:hypothetical protein n=1 Tax=Actinoplanes sp. NPDC051851 TaxID=3154753 RepID=UPI0034229871
MSGGTDPASDSDVRNDLAEGHASAGGVVGVTGSAGNYGASGSVDIGGVDILRFDAAKDLPARR